MWKSLVMYNLHIILEVAYWKLLPFTVVEA
jgi:hypothetical protein